MNQRNDQQNRHLDHREPLTQWSAGDAEPAPANARLRRNAAVIPKVQPALAGAASRSLTQLNEEADSLLNKLTRLRQKLTEMRGELHDTIVATTPLVEANEQLVLAALHAEAVAETAVSTLGQLAHSSQHDLLTDLPNRLLLLDRFETAIATARRHDHRIAVLFIDLDHFKHINDTLGHDAGDKVLQLVARRLHSAVRDSDTVSRYGGEEFVVLLPEIHTAADAAVLAEKLLGVIAAPSRVREHRMSLSASLGIALYPEDGEEAATLINRADAAMYRAKRRGPGRYEFYAEKQSLVRRLGEPPEAPSAA
jgi:diguanylate cyclase (GGDEF)-like protein